MNLKNKNPALKVAFTLVELLVVIAIIGILAGLLTYLAPRATRVKTTARLKADLAQLVAAIDSYHATMGFYPPDNILTNSGAPPRETLPPLFYELTGTIFTNGDFETVNAGEKISKITAQTVFGRGGFANSQPGNVHNFFKQLKAGVQYRPYLMTPVQVLVVPVEGPNDFPSPDPANPKPLNTWRYVSTNPTNNPGRYDLWAEFVVGGKTNLIGNWNQ
ncbi:MAG: type II secretion system protein [Limisphaerales bacterium]